MSLKDFQILAKLGEGTYSSVYKVKRLVDNIEYALKRVKLNNLSQKQKQNALNQVRILASIRHPNIVGYKQAFVDQSSNSLWQISIVMQFADNGDLYQKICQLQKKNQLLSENQIWNYLIQMVKGLDKLHQLKILHRDLKSANIFLMKDGIAKLGDMNVSKIAKRGMCQTQTGTPYYASPEVWKDQNYDSKSDIWSLGCVIYQMVTLKPPFRAEDMEELFKKVTRGSYQRIPVEFSQDLNSLIKSMLQTDPIVRPSCQKILKMPSVINHMSQHALIQPDQTTQSELLKTIHIPKNILNLTEKLPKPNYQPLQFRRASHSQNFITLQNIKKEEANSQTIITPSSIESQKVILKKGEKEKSLHNFLKKQKRKPQFENINSVAIQFSGSPRKNSKNEQSLVLPHIKKGTLDKSTSPKNLSEKIHQIRCAYKIKNNRYINKPKQQYSVGP